MARTAQEVANLLTEIYNESFGNDQCEKYRLGWADLRGLAGVAKLEEAYVAEIGACLTESDYALVSFGNFLLVSEELDFANERKLPARLLERYLPGEGEPENKNNVEDEEREDD